MHHAQSALSSAHAMFFATDLLGAWKRVKKSSSIFQIFGISERHIYDVQIPTPLYSVYVLTVTFDRVPMCKCSLLSFIVQWLAQNCCFKQSQSSYMYKMSCKNVVTIFLLWPNLRLFINWYQSLLYLNPGIVNLILLIYCFGCMLCI